MFCFPSPLNQNYREPKTYDLAVKRRMAWLKAVSDFPTFKPSQETSRVCSIHFLSGEKHFSLFDRHPRVIKLMFLPTGKPAKLVQESHEDWVPTVFMNRKDGSKPVGTTSRKSELFVIITIQVQQTYRQSERK